MNQELMDLLDETIQDLDEGGFDEMAEQLYSIAYDTEWQSDSELVEEIARGILRIQARQGDDIPGPITARMARCLEIARRLRPDMSLD